MKICFLYVESSKEEWLQSVILLYEKKISRFADFEIQKIKSPGLERSSKDQKLKAEEVLILKKILPTDFLILFDERGKELGSLEFSSHMQKIINQNPKRIVFLIGGAFGVSEAINVRANLKLSLSKLIFNHHIAIAVSLEQIYRSFTIQKGLPYHNV